MLNKKKIQELEKIAKQIRVDILQMSYDAKSAHMGGSFSCVEILVSLYFHSMKVFPKNPVSEKRDRFIFSKGHDAKALYAVLCARGYFPKEILRTYEQNNGKLPGHTTRLSVPGIEISSGSLGHGLPIATGMAFSGIVDKKSHRVFAMLSDGECDEGSTWEAILFAGHHKLHNLTVIVDYNKLQGFGYTKDILTLEPFADKWKSFNWKVKEVDGHNFNQIIKAVESHSASKPLVIIAHTVKGKGGPLKHVNKVSSQYKPPTDEELIEMTERLKK